MTTLVLQTAGGIIGSIIGGPIGGSIGALAGSLLGSLIDPPKIQGPRLGDTRLTRSAYGAMIPYAWGHGRIGTNIIDQTDLVEHKHKEGGKGGPEVTTYTYTASWCSALCARLPNREAAIAGITHIFADARLIWSQESGEECPCTVYVGTEDQDPDPTFEAVHGVGQVPGYRGIAYLTFTDFDLTDYGNRIPQIEVVIYTKGGDIPWRVSSFAPWDTGTFSNFHMSNATYANGVITATEIDGNNPPTFYIRKWDTDGNQIGTTVSQTIADSVGRIGAVVNLNAFLTLDTPSTYWWYVYDPATEQFQRGAGPTVGPAYTPGIVVESRNLYKNDFIYTLGNNAGNCYLSRFNAPGGTPGDYQDSVLVENTLPAANVTIMDSTDEFIYLCVANTGSFRMWRFNADLTLDKYWDTTETSGTLAAGGPLSGFVYNGLVEYVYTSGLNHYVQLIKINADDTLEDYGASIASANSHSVYLGGGLLLDSIGVYSLIPPAEPELLSDIVSDISSLTPAQSVDVSELTDEVRWYVIGSEMTARNAIEKLRAPFFFDAVEEDYSIVFRKRGDRDVIEIDEAELVPFDGTGDLLRTVRKREQELPRTVTMTYIDVDMDWQTGAQSSPRQVTQSEYDVTLEVPIGFTAQEAGQKCWTIQCAEWNERESFQWQTTRRWAYITPCTLVKVRGRIIRVQSVTESPDGRIAYEGVLAAPSIYTQVAPGASSGGQTAQNPSAPKVATELVLLDIPVISQSDSPFGFYAAMGPATDGTWGGATLFKSLDGGVTYEAVATTNSPAVIGRTQDVTGSPAYSGVLSAYGGGDVVEEASIVVVLTDPDAALESCTPTALENGANLCAISRGTSGGSPDVTVWEILQFRDATLLDDRTYLLTGFKRGRRGTSTADHDVGDTFVLLPATNVDAPASELNVSLKYKAVTYGRAITTAAEVDFINTGESTEEFYEVEAGHLPVYVNVQTGTTYTVTRGDRFRLITFNNSSPVAVTLPDGMPDGWNCFMENVGGGDVTLTPASWTIDDGAADLTLATDQGILLASDGEQWWTMRGMGSGGGGGGGMVVLSPSYAGTMTVDLTSYSAYPHVVVNVGALTGNITFNITNGIDGQIIRARFEQDGSGGRTFTGGANIRYSTDTPAPAIDLLANRISRLAFEWHAGDGKADLVAVNRGYS